MTFPTTGQTAYNNRMTQAVAGMWADNYEDLDIVSYYATANLPFGIAVQLDSGDSTGQSVTLPAYSSGLPTLVGVVLYVDTLAQSLAPTANVGHLAGTLVPVCRKGRIYCQLVTKGSNGAPTALSRPNIYCPTTNGSSLLKYAGFFTTDSTATSAGNEIQNAPAGMRFIRDITAGILTSAFDSSSSVCLIDVNFPNATSGN